MSFRDFVKRLVIYSCNRCNADILQDEDCVCWYCFRPLCEDCWEYFGHCGHEEAVMANYALQGEIMDLMMHPVDMLN